MAERKTETFSAEVGAKIKQEPIDVDLDGTGSIQWGQKVTSNDWSYQYSWSVQTDEHLQLSRDVPAMSKKERPSKMISLDGKLTDRGRREFVPDSLKNENYWIKRNKNNESAQKSRAKRKALEKIMEAKVVELQVENIKLKYELAALKRHFAQQLETERLSEDDSDSNDKLAGKSRIADAVSFVEDISDCSLSDESSYSSQTRQREQPQVLSLKQRVDDYGVVYNLPVAFTPATSHLSPTLETFYPKLVDKTSPKRQKLYHTTVQNDEERQIYKIPHKCRLKQDAHSAFVFRPSLKIQSLNDNARQYSNY